MCVFAIEAQCSLKGKWCEMVNRDETVPLMYNYYSPVTELSIL